MRKIILGTVAAAILATGAFADTTDNGNMDGFERAMVALNAKGLKKSMIEKSFGDKSISLKVGRFYDKAGLMVSYNDTLFARADRIPTYSVLDYGVGTNSKDFTKGGIFNGGISLYAAPFYWDKFEGTDAGFLISPLKVIVKTEAVLFSYESVIGEKERASDVLVGGGFAYSLPNTGISTEFTLSKGVGSEIDSELEASIKFDSLYMNNYNFAFNVKRTNVNSQSIDSYVLEHTIRF